MTGLSRYAMSCLFLLVGCSAGSTAFADTGIGVFLNKFFAAPGETNPTIYASAFNSGSVKVVDVHIGIAKSDGTIYEYPDGNTDLRPWLTDVALSETFEFPAAPIVTLPALPAGSWTAFAAFTEPGTTDIVSIDTAPFQILPQLAPGLNGARTYGVLALNRNQSAAGVAVDALGVFVRTANIEPVLDSFGRGSGGVGVDQCSFNQGGSLLSLSGQFNTLVAGESLSLSSAPDSSIEIPQELLLLFSFYAASAEPGFYESGKKYTFSGDGGDFSPIAGFSASVKAPIPLTLTQPAVSDSLTQDVSEDLALEWTGSNGIGVVEVQFVASDGDSIGTIGCRFVDDGQASIPSALLTQLRDSFPGAEYLLTVNRLEYALFDTARQDLDLGIAAATAGASLSVGLE